MIRKLYAKVKSHKKEKGSIDEFLPVLIFLFIALMFIILMLNINTALEDKNTLNAIARDSILKIESDGYLTTAEKQDLANRLNKAGFRATAADGDGSVIKSDCSNILGSTTTVTDPGYGSEVTLEFTVYKDTYFTASGTVTDKSADGEQKTPNIFTTMFKKTPTKMYIKISSTSKK